MALGRILPCLVALRYCGEDSLVVVLSRPKSTAHGPVGLYGAGHMIYGETVIWRRSRDIRWHVP